MEQDKETIDKEMQAISDMLDTALEFGMEVEIIYHALKYIKENPSVTPAQAFALGATEWVK
jgi:predicted RNA methylase